MDKKKGATTGQVALITTCVLSVMAMLTGPLDTAIPAAALFVAAFVSIFLLEIVRAIRENHIL